MVDIQRCGDHQRDHDHLGDHHAGDRHPDPRRSQQSDPSPEARCLAGRTEIAPHQDGGPPLAGRRRESWHHERIGQLVEERDPQRRSGIRSHASDARLAPPS